MSIVILTYIDGACPKYIKFLSAKGFIAGFYAVTMSLNLYFITHSILKKVKVLIN
ncbi:MAG: hypothetical protein KME21_24130 [Desmonostoc vinosum HA7617-LM4]|jgi:hypothetical protein|nr:hypothetical protein [Desmonostoc vinosum HA7617-LM4]